ncbi:FMN reductase (NADH) RutF [Acidocella aquatica]|uniref:FMN reductase (NADH) RutF n=1 Tax=Acidocella aquatica TaxID=1922313 RepID=A0ABQ6A4N6_9PROT|nr:flavin reductase [Acidocella aquatica]GLR65512.1 FMN reductase (NADH) RutF [Acidocella aquatica]
MIESRTRFREAMSRLGAAVNIITTTGPLGDTGFTASAVCSVTDDPATVLVCMNRASRQHDIFQKSGVLCVNILAPADEDMAAIFAGQPDLPMPERFARASWLRLATGAPVLESAAAALDCRISQVLEVGSHSVIFGLVQAIHLGPATSGLIYHRRTYHRLVSDKSA